MYGMLVRRYTARLVKDDDVVVPRGDAALHSRGILRFSRVDRNRVAGRKGFVYRLVQRFFAHRLFLLLLAAGCGRIVARRKRGLAALGLGIVRHAVTPGLYGCRRHVPS